MENCENIDFVLYIQWKTERINTEKTAKRVKSF